MDPETERIVVGTRDGMLRCLSPVDGHVEWEFKTYSRFFAGAAIDQGVVYAPGGDGVLYALKVRTGEKLWEYKAGEELVTTPVIVGTKLLVLQPIGADGENAGRTLVALDSVGAGTGEHVFFVRGREAAFAFYPAEPPTDAAIVGIVDHWDVE